MAKAIIEHNPDLTKEHLKKILSHHFTPKGYEVGFSSLLATDIYIKKNDWVGVGLRIKQKQKSTSIIISGYAPSIFVRILFLGIIPILILLPKWREMENEVKKHLTSAQYEFDSDTL